MKCVFGEDKSFLSETFQSLSHNNQSGGSVRHWNCFLSKQFHLISVQMVADFGFLSPTH